ncbi:hypothetical protein [Cellulomonas sp. NS3]|uniref:hypothetical protein n=1 Tax=Cellulomonas sp. NS3 TaxID=2973977 RepID=UPI002161431D|nr:hypothetical protein [Cellulomonas sp. NS3]
MEEPEQHVVLCMRADLPQPTTSARAILADCGCLVWAAPATLAFLDTDPEIVAICGLCLAQTGVEVDELRVVPRAPDERQP